MPMKNVLDLWQLLVILAYALAFGGVFGIGLAVGINRGYAKSPEKYKEAYLNEQQKRLVAEGRLEAEQRASRRVDAALNALTAQPESAVERQGLRIAKGGRE